MSYIFLNQVNFKFFLSFYYALHQIKNVVPNRKHIMLTWYTHHIWSFKKKKRLDFNLKGGNGLEPLFSNVC